MTGPIPMADLTAHRAVIGADIDRRMAAVLDHGRWIMGPEVTEFEAAAVAYIGDPTISAVACANGTDALVLAFAALGLQPGQAVICPSFTFVATAEAVATLGGIPIFAEVGEEEFNLSANGVRLAHKTATEAGHKVVGICSVDLFGAPAPLSELSPLAESLGCWLVSDGAQSFGAESGGVRTGALAEVTTTSFFPAKPLGCYGDGGMVFARDHAVADAMRSLRVHGKGSHKYDNVRVGQNSRLDTLQAAVLLAKLDHLDTELAGRRRVAARYDAGLSDAPGVLEQPLVRSGDSSAWAQYTVVHRDRDGLHAALHAAGIDSAIYYPRPLHRQPAYEHFHLMDADLGRTDRLSRHVLSLPMHPYLRDDQIDRVIETVRSVP